MKKKLMGLLLIILFISKVQAQTGEVEQLLLNVEKLAQLKQTLSDLKKGYEIIAEGYSTIKNISEGNFRLHEVFLDGLLQVSPAVKSYHRIKDILLTQGKLVDQCKSALQQFKRRGEFTPEEITYLSNVYAALYRESLKDLDELLMVITSGVLRLSDDERLRAIDQIWKASEEKLVFLQQFTNRNSILALQRAKERNQVRALGRLYGVKQ